MQEVRASPRKSPRKDKSPERSMQRAVRQRQVNVASKQMQDLKIE